MKSIVITGSTRGIGHGLAAAFLDLGCKVVVSGRGASGLERVVRGFEAKHPGRIAGAACDVAKTADLEGLWKAARDAFGTVDVWINNAGISIRRGPLHEADPRDIEAIVATNLTGLMIANRIVIAGMLEQGHGQVWNMEGFGSTGMTQPGIAAYGTTKRAVNYLNAALQKDLKGKPVHVCTLSPGVVITELLVKDYDTSSADWQRAKRFFNILGDKVETVTPWLAERVLATDQPGARVEWLSMPKAMGRFMMARFRKRDLFEGIEGA